MKLFRIIIMTSALITFGFVAYRLYPFLDMVGVAAIWFCIAAFSIEVIEDAVRYAEVRFNRAVERDVSDMMSDLDDIVLRSIADSANQEVTRLNLEAKA